MQSSTKVFRKVDNRVIVILRTIHSMQVKEREKQIFERALIHSKIERFFSFNEIENIVNIKYFNLTNQNCEIITRITN